VKHLGIQSTTKPSQLSLPSPRGKQKSSTGLHGWGLGGALICVGWKVILSDAIWQVMLCRSVMGSHNNTRSQQYLPLQLSRVKSSFIANVTNTASERCKHYLQSYVHATQLVTHHHQNCIVLGMLSLEFNCVMSSTQFISGHSCT